MLNHNYFFNINCQSKAYYLGLLASDGNIAKKTNRIQFILSTKDDYILKRLKSELNCSNKIRRYKIYDRRTNKYYLSSVFAFSSEKIKNDLKKHGIDSYKTTSFRKPVNIPVHYMRHFIRGLFDGDGCASIKHNSIRISLISSKEFLLYIKRKLFKNKAHIACVNASLNVWKLHIQRTGTCQDFLNYIYANSTIHLKRKYKKYIISKNFNRIYYNKNVSVLVYRGKKMYRKFSSIKACASHYNMSACNLLTRYIERGNTKHGLSFLRGATRMQSTSTTIPYKSYFKKII